MTIENARVLHKQLLEVGRTNAAEDIERRYPELKKERPAEKEEVAASETEVSDPQPEKASAAATKGKSKK